MNLKKRLESLRADLAAAAQRVIDEWQPDEYGWDEGFGAGGACDEVAKAMSEVVAGLEGVEIQDGGHEGDDHAYLVVYDADEAFAVDIPPDIYETGGGYSWKKVEGARISPGDILITELDRDLISDW